MQSKATTVKDYLAELPADRREAIQAVREVILKNLDKGFEEGMQYGAIGYYVPHRLYPAGYHCDPSKPLPFAGLGSQKNHLSLGIMSHYGDSPEGKWFKAAWAKTGKKLDMGACCIRFKKVEDLAMDVIGESIRRMPADRFIEQYEAARQGRGKGGAPVRKSPKKAAGKKAASPKKATTRIRSPKMAAKKAKRAG